MMMRQNPPKDRGGYLLHTIEQFLLGKVAAERVVEVAGTLNGSNFLGPWRDGRETLLLALRRLQEGDKEAWAFLLYQASMCLNRKGFGRLKALSPFAGQVIMFVSRSIEGNISIQGGELLDMIAAAILRNMADGGVCVHDFLLALPSVEGASSVALS